MALELFKPFCHETAGRNPKSVQHQRRRKEVERVDPSVWDRLRLLSKSILSCSTARPPSIAFRYRRLSLCSSRDALYSSTTLVCAAFNADDGDGMRCMSAFSRSSSRGQVLCFRRTSAETWTVAPLRCYTGHGARRVLLTVIKKVSPARDYSAVTTTKL